MAIGQARYAWLEFFDGLSQHAPSGVWITDLTLENETKQVIDFTKPTKPSNSTKSRIQFIQMKGSYLVHEEDPKKLLEQFRERFNDSIWFKKIEAKDPKTGMSNVTEDEYELGDWTMTFQWHPELQKPISY